MEHSITALQDGQTEEALLEEELLPRRQAIPEELADTLDKHQRSLKYRYT